MARKNLKKLTARDGKSIITHMMNLPTASLLTLNEPHSISKLSISNSSDLLLFEAISQITTLNPIYNNQTIITQPSRYIWKLKKENVGSIRQYFCRLILPIGILFFIRNTTSPIIYEFDNYGQCVSLKNKLKNYINLNITENNWYISESMWGQFVEPALINYVYGVNYDVIYSETLCKFNELIKENRS